MPTPVLDNRQLGPDVGRANQFVNGGFEFNQRGLTTYASGVQGLDRWFVSAVGTGAFSSSGPDTTHQDISSLQCLATVVTATSGGSGGSGNWVVTQQNLEQFKVLRGQILSTSFRVQSAIAGSARIYWYDGNYNYSPAVATPAGSYTTVRYTFTPAANATTLYVGVTLDTVTTWYVDNATLVLGSQPCDYVPLHPADDLNRCLRYYEVIGGLANGSIIIRSYQAAGAAVQSSLRFVPKAVTPTITKVGTWAVVNCGQPNIGSPAVESCSFYSTVTTTADTYFWNNASGACVTVEANP